MNNINSRKIIPTSKKIRWYWARKTWLELTFPGKCSRWTFSSYWAQQKPLENLCKTITRSCCTLERRQTQRAPLGPESDISPDRCWRSNKPETPVVPSQHHAKPQHRPALSRVLGVSWSFLSNIFNGGFSYAPETLQVQSYLVLCCSPFPISCRCAERGQKTDGISYWLYSPFFTNKMNQHDKCGGGYRKIPII